MWLQHWPTHPIMQLLLEVGIWSIITSKAGFLLLLTGTEGSCSSGSLQWTDNGPFLSNPSGTKDNLYFCHLWPLIILPDVHKQGVTLFFDCALSIHKNLKKETQALFKFRKRFCDCNIGQHIRWCNCCSRWAFDPSSLHKPASYYCRPAQPRSRSSGLFATDWRCRTKVRFSPILPAPRSTFEAEDGSAVWRWGNSFWPPRRPCCGPGWPPAASCGRRCRWPCRWGNRPRRRPVRRSFGDGCDFELCDDLPSRWCRC